MYKDTYILAILINSEQSVRSCSCASYQNRLQLYTRQHICSKKCLACTEQEPLQARKLITQQLIHISYPRRKALFSNKSQFGNECLGGPIEPVKETVDLVIPPYMIQITKYSMALHKTSCSLYSLSFSCII